VNVARVGGGASLQRPSALGCAVGRSVSTRLCGGTVRQHRGLYCGDAAIQLKTYRVLLSFLCVTLPVQSFLCVTLPVQSFMCVTLPVQSFLCVTLPVQSFMCVTLPVQ
jgi:hypothetical protein